MATIWKLHVWQPYKTTLSYVRPPLGTSVGGINMQKQSCCNNIMNFPSCFITCTKYESLSYKIIQDTPWSVMLMWFLYDTHTLWNKLLWLTFGNVDPIQSFVGITENYIFGRNAKHMEICTKGTLSCAEEVNKNHWMTQIGFHITTWELTFIGGKGKDLTCINMLVWTWDCHILH